MKVMPVQVSGASYLPWVCEPAGCVSLLHAGPFVRRCVLEASPCMRERDGRLEFGSVVGHAGAWRASRCAALSMLLFLPPLGSPRLHAGRLINSLLLLLPPHRRK